MERDFFTTFDIVRLDVARISSAGITLGLAGIVAPWLGTR